MGASLDDLDPYRLPTRATPTRYDVELRPDLDDATFTGRVAIEVSVAEPAEHLVLNAIELDIKSCAVGGRSARFELDEANERLIVTPDSPLTVGEAELQIEFAGVLNDKLRGFYRSTYEDGEGNEQVIATTQMQSTDCRRAFPCWDEPEFKAVFGITLDIEAGLEAISNGPEVERTAADGRVRIRFADTMLLSSYLVAFVVGRLEITDEVDVDGIPLRIVHVPGKAGLTGLGLEVGAFCLRWFQEYYGIPYPAEKVDLVALPDFAAGAMENLGCITFRESLVLVDPDTSTQDEQQNVVDVIAHELSHMWFGDLVTMRWWNGIWLNEAFATFMEVAACAAFRPEWERWTAFGLERSVAFATDSLASTRPVEYEVESPADCEGMFDVLTYEKGGALVRMLEQYLGEERFRAGVSHYLRAHQYGNTETNDLWDAIEETSGEPVRRIMDSWIWQPGYPLVSASLSGTDPDQAIELTQRRFRFDESEGADGTAGSWAIPVRVSEGSETTSVLLDDQPVRVPLQSPDQPVVVNAGGHGFYRVAYDDALRGRLTGPAIRSLSTLERHDLVDDAWAATVAGRMSAADLLGFLGGFVGERDHAVWQAIVVSLRAVSRIVADDARDAFRRRVRDLVGPALADLGEPAAGEQDLTAKLRGLLTSTMGTLGRDDATIDRAGKLFDRADADPTAVDAELLSAATTIVAATGGSDEFERIVDGYRTGSTPQDKLRHLNALAEFDDAELIRRVCDFAFSDEVKTQNAPFLLRLTIANPEQGELAWEIVRSRWAEANEKFPTNTIVRMIDPVSLLTRPEQVADVAAFFAEHPIRQAATTLDQILERQRVNAALRARESAELSSALRAGA